MFYLSDFKHIHPQKFTNRIRNSKRSLSFRKKLFDALNEFCMESSLHGLKYIREPRLPLADRVFWLVITMGCLLISVYVILELYMSGFQQFDLSFDPVNTPVWEIPFPAIQICPLYAVRKSVFNLEHHPNETKLRHYSKLICPASYLEFPPERFTDVIDEEFFRFIEKVALPCEEIMTKCYWKNSEKNCCSIFNPVLTTLGKCYAFNNMPGQLLYTHYSIPEGTEDLFDDEIEYWNVNTGYTEINEKRQSAYPKWSEYKGESFGFTVELVDRNIEWQQLCSGGQTGFEVKIYSPDENPEETISFKISNNVHNHVVVTPVLIKSDQDLVEITPEERGCLFQDEVQLDYFKAYTQSGCYLECMVKKVLEQCGCVPFTAYKFLGNHNYLYCSDAMIPCQLKVIDQLHELGYHDGFVIDICFCLPACSTLSFEYQSNTQPIVSSSNTPPWAKNYNTSSKSSIARLSLYYGTQQFSIIQRKMTSTFRDFLGSCGGLLGLLLGFSFISAFEVLYFIIIRPITKVVSFFITEKQWEQSQ